MKVQNPVIPGFHPDPSVCRVGQDYYLVTSSFEYFPGVPIFHSRDLVNWTQIGHCLTRKSQLNLDGHPPSTGIYAPTIRYHDGTFYMITTDIGGRGNFYVTTGDPAGPWSEPIFVDQDMFDPSLFFDDDGKVYYTRRGGGFRGIVQAEIDIQTGRLTTPLRQIVDKFICPDIEGPHLYKINGLYYLMAAEGGTRFGHAEVIGRSSSPWGPFEPCPHNPIVTHRDKGHGLIRDTGHAELIQDHNGYWWLFCLGTRNRTYNSASILGRETFLAPVTWISDGWPVVGEGGMIAEAFETGDLPLQRSSPSVWHAEMWRDDFDAPTLDPGWNFLRNPNAADWSLTARPGCLRLKGSAVSLDAVDSPAFVGRRQQHFDVTASCQLDFLPQSENEEAGLTVYMNHRHHYDLGLTLWEGQRCVVLKKTVADMVQIFVSDPLGPGTVTLRVTSDGTTYDFYYEATGGNGLQHIGSGVTKLLSPEIAASPVNSAWTGVYLAMYATGNGKPCAGPADFDCFAYHVNPPRS